MAELILTEQEMARSNWSDLDDNALGKILRRNIVGLQTVSEQFNRADHLTAGLLLCAMAHESNADALELTLDNVTFDGEEIGHWSVTVRKQ